MERENTGRTKYGRKKSLSLQLIFCSFKDPKIPLPPNTPHQSMGDHVPNHPISKFTKLAYMLETR